MEDEAFLAKFGDQLESFGKDDLLEADLRTTQFVLDDRIRVEFAVVKVHEHQRLSIPGTHKKFYA